VNLLSNAVELVKQAALEAVEASKPVRVLFGKVISISPLKVQADQKSIYTEKMLILTQRLSGNLRTGDKILLLRMQGGKKFVAIDRL